MHTKKGSMDHSCLGKYAFFKVRDMGKKNSRGGPFILFTCHRTSITANTSFEVDNDSILHNIPPLVNQAFISRKLTMNILSFPS